MRNAWAALLLVLTAACSRPSSEAPPAPTPSQESADASAPTPGLTATAHRRRPPLPTAPPQAPDTRTKAQVDVAACTGADGSWRCKMPKPQTFGATTAQPIIPASWTVPLWVTDPANSIGCASDNNTGTSASCVGGCSGATCPSGQGPLVTVNELIVHRWGTSSPMLQQTTDIWPISSETVGQERIRPLSPVMANAGSNFELICTPTNIGSTFLAGTVTTKSQVNPGTDLKIASMPAGAAAGVLVKNLSRLGPDSQPSYAIIHSMSGATATMDQPLNGTTTVSLSYTITENNAWTTGDTLQMLQPCGMNLTSMSVQVTDDNAAFTGGIAWMGMIHVLDISGVVGNSTLNILANGATYWGMSVFDPLLNFTSVANPAEGAALAGCQFNGGIQAGGGQGLLSAAIVGGDIFTNLNLIQNSTVYNDAILAGFLEVLGNNSVSMHIASGGELFVGEGAAFLSASTGTGLWGAGSVVVRAGAGLFNAGGVTWAVGMIVQTSNFADARGNLQTTGTAYSSNDAGIGTWTDNIAITSANLDAHDGGLVNPRTGARFAQN